MAKRENTSPLLSRGSKVGGMIWVAPVKGSGLPFWREEHWHMDKRRLLRALSSVLFFLFVTALQDTMSLTVCLDSGR